MERPVTASAWTRSRRLGLLFVARRGAAPLGEQRSCWSRKAPRAGDMRALRVRLRSVPGIYLKYGDAYVSMTETPYDSEGVLCVQSSSRLRSSGSVFTLSQSICLRNSRPGG